MSARPRSLDDRGIEATFIAGPTVRSGALALWDRRDLTGLDTAIEPREPGEIAAPGTEEITLIVPDGDRIRRRTVPVTRLSISGAIDALDQASPSATPSVRAWAHALRATLGLIARGRLLPTVDVDGSDLWRAGPLDASDLVFWRDLSMALPGPAHAAELEGAAPRRVTSPAWALARFRDAVVDAYIRTAGASAAAGHEAFAARASTPVAGSAAWLAVATSAGTGDVALSLRIDGDLDGPLEPGAGAEPAEDGSLRGTLVVTARRDPSLVLTATEVWQAPTAVAARFGDDIEAQVLLALRRAARVWPPIERMLAEQRPDHIIIEPDEVADLLGPRSDELARAGLELLWPAGLVGSIAVTPRISSGDPSAIGEPITADRSAGLGLQDVCEIRWDAIVDGRALGDDDLQALVEAKRSVVRLRGRWVRVEPGQLARLTDRRAIDTRTALVAALDCEVDLDGELIPIEADGPIAELAAKLRSAEDLPEVAPAPDLEADLRPYQLHGLRWLASMADLGLGGILADDMGLGKTVQFLALHLHRRDRHKPTLVICPRSVIANWEREANRFAPRVPVRRFHAATRDLEDLADDEIVLTTYGVIRRQSEELASVEWGLIAADEAQHLKNPRSRTARSARVLRADARFALTGTPVENRLLDLWALLDWTTPGLLGPQDRFRREVAAPIERDGDSAAAESLARLVAPFTLRRRKVDPGIAPDLPPKTETDEVVGLTTEQATLYAAMVAEVMEEIETAEGFARRGLVLKLIGGLKQICNHPAQFLRQGGPLPGRSGKLDAVDELVQTITDEGQSVLVFTQYVTMAKLLVEHLRRPDRTVEVLHGSVPAPARQELVDRFQAGEIPVLVVSLRAGGTGLNLTRATHVIHYDRWWNPAVEDQASDRAWRIGQTLPVQVHRMICEGTVEDRVAGLLHQKRGLAESVIGAGESWVGDLDDDDLRALVTLGEHR